MSGSLDPDYAGHYVWPDLDPNCQQTIQAGEELTVNCRIPTSSGNHGKPGKSLKKSSMHGNIMEYEKT